ncbi:LADA_0H14554g1_1 [Lachancea dasiensis]|uniref:LADA_0H14554g1_1 n=1 Tax=Lachancea dasiensis TaxID=1072105 RepID=A0A1G4K4S2_9SACH|nr:LADA_0H14554g1_1 [Lachancea dasiensis]
MNKSNEIKAVERRLAVYNPDTQLNTYLSAVSELSTVCFAALTGKLEDKHALSLENVQNWRKNLKLKRLDAELYVEVEKLKVAMEAQSADQNIDEIKQHLKKDLTKLSEGNEVMRRRNMMLRTLNSHIDLVNEQMEDMQRGRSKLSAPHDEWEKQLGTDEVTAMLDANVLKRELVKVREGDTEIEYEELSLLANFSKDTTELQRTNSSMKDSAKRLRTELQEYQDKWSHNAGLFDKISDVLKEELAKRELSVQEAAIQDTMDEEDEVEDEEDEEAVRGYHEEGEVESDGEGAEENGMCGGHDSDDVDEVDENDDDAADHENEVNMDEHV